jgi:hypothetical protein
MSWQPLQNKTDMKTFTVEAIFVLIGIVISVIYIFYPTPLWMTLFLFVAQPCFIYAFVSSAVTIKKDLRSKDII